jgi:hypothetical protein
MEIRNALTVDVEDYFHVTAFAEAVPQGDWDRYPARVEQNTKRLLEIFAGENVQATFRGSFRRSIARGIDLAVMVMRTR